MACRPQRPRYAKDSARVMSSSLSRFTSPLNATCTRQCCTVSQSAANIEKGDIRLESSCESAYLVLAYCALMALKLISPSGAQAASAALCMRCLTTAPLARRAGALAPRYGNSQRQSTRQMAGIQMDRPLISQDKRPLYDIYIKGSPEKGEIGDCAPYSFLVQNWVIWAWLVCAS